MPGPKLGVDVGDARVGVAICDAAGILATPLETLPRDRSGESDLVQLQRIVAERGIVEVVVGLPRLLSGKDGRASATAKRYATRLARLIAPIPVRLHDERMTTVIAGRALSERGVRGKKHRAVVDQAAAVVILQSWLDRRPTSSFDPED